MVMHFFASVYQATHPEAKGKPVAIGQERAIATAVSYEAKARGVKRGMLISEIKKNVP
ncbi:MAG: DNA polymerase IV [Microgenomates bacterium OLB23]|nr:MAG: DNA polymerase IV [Microgenomates bacterium OLB23]